MTELTMFYEVSWLEYGHASRVARPIDHDRRFSYRLRKPGRIEPEPHLTWEWLSPEHPPEDIVVALDGMRVVSPLVREIFDTYRTPKDVIQWLPGTVIDADGERLAYWIPHFPVHDDLIDPERSTYGPSGLPIRYTLASEKVADHAVTAIPGTPFSYVLAEPVVDALKAAGAKGIMYMPAPVS